MRIRRTVIVLDAANLHEVSRFWAGVFDGTVDEDENWHSVLDADGQWRMGVQYAPDHRPPNWPFGEPQQLHLDLWVDDIDEAHDRVMGLGAEYLQPDEDTGELDRFRVYADPAGHPFCLCWVVNGPIAQEGR